ncbi:MAG: O-methyltransferase [Clostridiales bacterium]|nr:O-methyltransferase [Clostridiales bacterium]
MKDIISDVKSAAFGLSVPIMRDESADALVFLTGVKRPKKILEIGTGIGYSGILMLTAAEEAFLTTVEIDCASARLAKENFARAGLTSRVRVIEGDAAEAAVMLDSRFDLILIDGAKGQYERLRPYLAGLLNRGGTIFADNVLFKGYVKGGYPGHKHRTIVKSLSAFIKNMKDDAGFNTELKEIGDGVLIAEKISD